MSLSFINPKGRLKREADVVKARDKIIQKLSEVPDYINRRMDLEMLLMVCIATEHLLVTSDPKHKHDKKEFVLSVYTRLFNAITPAEIKTIEQNIQFLYDAGKIVKKSLWSIVKHSVADWFHRKIIS